MFRTNDSEYESLVAENEFVTDVQLAIERAMKDKKMSQVQLARALDVSEARVSQILSSNGKNLQARTIARIAHILDLQALVEFAERSQACGKIDVKKWSKLTEPSNAHGWNDFISNDNNIVWAKAA